MHEYNPEDKAVKLSLMFLFSRKSNSFLPELYDIVGYDTMLQLLSVFASSTIAFPSATEWSSYYRKSKTYLLLSKATSVQKIRLVEQLALEFDMDEQAVWMSYYNIQKEINSLGFNLLLKGTV